MLGCEGHVCFHDLTIFDRFSCSFMAVEACPRLSRPGVFNLHQPDTVQCAVISRFIQVSCGGVDATDAEFSIGDFSQRSLRGRAHDLELKHAFSWVLPERLLLLPGNCTSA